MRTVLRLPTRRALGAATLSAAIASTCVCGVAQAQVENDPVARYGDALQRINGRLTHAASYELAQRFLLLATYYRIDPPLLMAIVTTESSWHARAASPVGALGYGQLMPATAAGLGVDPLEPYENLDGTARYLRRLLNRYQGRSQSERLRLAVASYNAGPRAVDRYGGVPPYRETQAYVANVLRLRNAYAGLGSAHDLSIRQILAGRTKPAAHRPGILAAQANPFARERLYHRPAFEASLRDPYEPPNHPATQRARRGFLARLFHRRHAVEAATIPAASYVNVEPSRGTLQRTDTDGPADRR
jgi:hypothetical protein